MKVVWGIIITLLISIRNVVSFIGVIVYASGGNIGTYTVCIRYKGDEFMLNI